MIYKCVKAQVQNTVVGCGSIWVVPFEILGNAVPNIDRLPERIVTIVECSSGCAETRRKTRDSRSSPSTPTFVFAESGVSGSISPVRMFFKRSTLPLLMHRGLSLHGSGDVVYFFNKSSIIHISSGTKYLNRKTYKTGYPMNNTRSPTTISRRPPMLTKPLLVKISQSLSLSPGPGLCR